MASTQVVGSPANEDKDKLSSKAFGKKLDVLAKHHNNILKLASKVYSLGKTQRLQYPNGASVGRKEIRTLSSQFVKELKALKKDYTDFGKKSKRKKREGGSAGFKNPILVTDNMREFFSQANLGPSGLEDTGVRRKNKKGEEEVVYRLNPNSPPLNTVLAVGQNGVTTRAIMTPLFNIYAQVNDMQKDPENKQFLTSTPEMDRYFQETYRTLEARPQKYQKDKETGKPDMAKPIPKFDPKRFRYASIQSIVAENTVPKANLSDEQKAVLADLPVDKSLPVNPETGLGVDPSNPHRFIGTPQQIAIANSTIERLEQEQDLVSGILSVYRDAKKEAAKAAKNK